MRERRNGLVALLLSCCVACAQTAGAAPAMSAAELHPQTQPLDYATKPTPGLWLGDAVTDALRDALAQACADAGLKPDGRLAQIALQIAETNGRQQTAPQAAALSYYARRVGLTDPTPQLWLASASPPELLLEPIREAVARAKQSEALTHCGAAAVHAGDVTVVAVAMSRRLVSLRESVPRTLELGAQLTLRAELAKGHDRAVLAVTPPRGEVQRTALPKGRAIKHTLRFSERGEHMIELLAEGPSGVTVVAMFPITVGEPEAAPQVVANAGEPERDADEVARNLAQLIDRERTQRNLPQLRIDTTLARVSQAHSQDMLEHHFIAHTSPTTGEAIDRVERAGINISLLLENIGRGYSAAEIHAGLMESPGHRANILNPDVRLLGIGVVAEREGTRQAFLATQLFAQLMPADATPAKAKRKRR